MDPQNSQTTSSSSQDDLKTPSGGNRQQALVEDVVKAFHEEVTPNPGFREGSAPAPERYREAVEVTSWLQVPSILNKLQSGEAQNIRLLFPTPKESTVVRPEHIDAFVEEQFAIADFIKAHHTKPIETITELLTQKIEKSFSLALLRATKPGAENITAAEWVNATLPSPSGSKALSVTTFFPLENNAISSNSTVNSLIVSFVELINTARPIVVTIVNTDPERLTELAVLLNALQGPDSVMREFRPEISSSTKVWVGSNPGELHTTHAPNTTPCAEVKEYSLQDFIEKFKRRDGGATPPAPEPTGPQTSPQGSAPMGATTSADATAKPTANSTPPSGNTDPTPSTSADGGASGPKTSTPDNTPPPHTTTGDKTAPPSESAEKAPEAAQGAPTTSPATQLLLPGIPDTLSNEEAPPRGARILRAKVEIMATEARDRRKRFLSRQEVEDADLSVLISEKRPPSNNSWD